MFCKYIGSIDDTIIHGNLYRYQENDCYEIHNGNEWIRCHEVVVVYSDGTVEPASPAV